MPVQDFRRSPDDVSELHNVDRLIGLRRFILTGGSFLLGLFCAIEIARPLSFDGIDSVDAVLILLFFGLFAWIGFGFLSSTAGFVSLLRSGPSLPQSMAQSRLPERKTAILIPIYNEDIVPLSARIRAMMRSVEHIGGAQLFEFFILSDSAATAEPAESAAILTLRSEFAVPIYYRRREKNIARKPGNIAEWVRRFGAAYEKMIILDADSVMSGLAMVRLANMMEANPRLGLVQTTPVLAGSKTLFARWQQYAATIYGPIASAGLQWWSGFEATFWGHNAILRTAAFAESCGLPELSGGEPFGGHIMSHDMVEAALLRRRGWAAQVMILPEGSYEEFPPTLMDHAIRDRRWCQGNIQHLRLLHTAGFHWINRLQLLMGASAYLTSPLWLLLLVAGVTQAVRAELPAFLFQPSSWLLILTMTLLFVPKLLSLAWVLFVDQDLRERMGGARRILLSAVAEIPLAVALAPVIMFSQCKAIIEIVRGKPSGWAPQRRDVDGLDVSEAFYHYRHHLMAGAFFGLNSMTGLDGAIWTLPIALSLLGSPLLAMYTSRVSAGNRAARLGIFANEVEDPDMLLASSMPLRAPTRSIALGEAHAGAFQR